MTKLAESSGTVIYETGNKLYISKRPAQWTTVFLFVVGLLALILFANGVLQLVGMKSETANSSLLGIILVGIALLFSLVFVGVKRHHQKVRAIPPQELKHVAIIDLQNNNLLDDQQNILTPLNQAWLTRKMQITSSSPELMIQWNHGQLSVAKGNPFSGGIAGIENVLVSKGLRKK
jgi:hypothetical protein